MFDNNVADHNHHKQRHYHDNQTAQVALMNLEENHLDQGCHWDPLGHHQDHKAQLRCLYKARWLGMEPSCHMAWLASSCTDFDVPVTNLVTGNEVAVQAASLMTGNEVVVPTTNLVNGTKVVAPATNLMTGNEVVCSGEGLNWHHRHYSGQLQNQLGQKFEDA